MYFSPAYISSLIVRPLRFFFEYYAPDDLKWSSDINSSCIEIDTINNFNKIAVERKPRILVTRGQYGVTPVGLSDNLAESIGIYQKKGSTRNTNMVMISGVAQVLIEARNEGTCEKVLDLTQHFLAWTAPMIASTQGFKTFGLPLNVSSCTPGKEDTEIFTNTLNIPWSKEEQWAVNSDDIAIKNFLLTLTAE